jgi:hypothetical protein
VVPLGFKGLKFSTTASLKVLHNSSSTHNSTLLTFVGDETSLYKPTNKHLPRKEDTDILRTLTFMLPVSEDTDILRTLTFMLPVSISAEFCSFAEIQFLLELEIIRPRRVRRFPWQQQQ